jgi:hypothetical protein
MIPDYIADTGDHDWTSMKIAAWAIKNDKWNQRQGSAVKELARTISRVAGKATFVDEENGDTVRKYHAWRLGHDQPMLWSAMDEITRENMKFSINSRRDKLVNGAVKGIIDAEYFNKHHNPGDPIVLETDLTKDVAEKRQPGLYDDTGPDDDET